MRITRWGEYGILCCLYLAKRSGEKTAIGAAEIAEAQHIPLQYAQQILHRLRKGGVVESVRGPHGGFRLSARSEEITLKDILYAAEGATFEVICDTNPVYEECASAPGCGLKTIWHELKTSIDQVLSSRSLKSLLDLDQSFDSSLVPVPNRSSATNRLQTNGAEPGEESSQKHEFSNKVVGEKDAEVQDPRLG